MTDTPFPFMELRRELHDHIYDCYFEDIAVMDTKTKRRYWFDTILDSNQEKSTSIPRRAFSITVLRPYLAILHSSSQVRTETAPIFYKQHIGGADLQLARALLRHAAGVRLLRKFCSSAAVYNIGARLTIVLETGASGDWMVLRSVEALLNAVIQQPQASVGSVTPSQTVLLCKHAYSAPQLNAVLRKILEIVPQMAGFDFGYTPTRQGDTVQHGFRSLFFQGPMARID